MCTNTCITIQSIVFSVILFLSFKSLVIEISSYWSGSKEKKEKCERHNLDMPERDVIIHMMNGLLLEIRKMILTVDFYSVPSFLRTVN